MFATRDTNSELALRFDSLSEPFRNAIRRCHGVSLRRCQLDAAKVLLRPALAELDTGEGKTFVAAIAAATLATSGHTVLIATSNDYLAGRDSAWMKGLYQHFGLSVGCVTEGSSHRDRRRAYATDIAYGTMRTFGFDKLRDQLATALMERSEKTGEANRRPSPDRFTAMLVDEADSVLIDDARTPLVLTSPVTATAEEQACFQWCAEVAADFQPVDDFTEHDGVALTRRGRQRFLRLPMPRSLNDFTTTDIQHRLEQAIWARTVPVSGKDYIVTEGRIELIDENTGRVSANRQLGAGLHQALEAREQLPPTPMTRPGARMTIQEFASGFQHLCGITGTAMEARRELGNVYGLSVARVAPHFLSRRRLFEPRTAVTADEKRQLIVDEVAEMVERGRCVLLGTRTVEDSEQMSVALTRRRLPHVVLNARQDEHEAEVIARAGMRRQITVATNMAGRGTDIQLDDQARAAGGLHVILSECHASSRIDRQMIGRAGRQGDPGSARQYGAADDPLLSQAFGASVAREIQSSAVDRGSGSWLWKKLIRAQQLVERQHICQRAALADAERAVRRDYQTLGFDPHLDPLPD